MKYTLIEFFPYQLEEKYNGCDIYFFTDINSDWNGIIKYGPSRKYYHCISKYKGTIHDLDLKRLLYRMVQLNSTVRFFTLNG